MKLFEYQSKRLFGDNGIPVPKGRLITGPEDTRAAALEVGFPCVLKCQVLSGGRGKAGMVRRADTPDEAEAIARRYFREVPGLKTVLVEEAVRAERELFLSCSVDAVSGRGLLMGCALGGVDIESVAREHPNDILKECVDLDRGLQRFQLNDFLWRLDLRGEPFKQAAAVTAALFRLFLALDAELAEINPLFITPDGRAVAGDAKLVIDDNSLFRHPQFTIDREHYPSDMAFEAAQEGIPYLEFGGDISLMCAGAGLANTVYDLVSFAGGKIANYLEFGGPNYMKAGTAIRLCLANRPRVILIVTFGTIARADVMAEGIAGAIRELRPDCPIVACLRGTGEEKVEEILAASGVLRAPDTEEAVRLAVEIAGKGGMG